MFVSQNLVPAQGVAWVLENKDWEYLNLEYLMQNNSLPPQCIESVRLNRCKLEETCLVYVVQMIQANANAEKPLTEAVFTDVSCYG